MGMLFHVALRKVTWNKWDYVFKILAYPYTCRTPIPSCTFLYRSCKSIKSEDLSIQEMAIATPGFCGGLLFVWGLSLSLPSPRMPCPYLPILHCPWDLILHFSLTAHAPTTWHSLCFSVMIHPSVSIRKCVCTTHTNSWKQQSLWTTFSFELSLSHAFNKQV